MSLNAAVESGTGIAIPSASLAGTAMALIGVWRQQRGQTLIPLDRFGFGFAFAFAMALVRLTFAK